MSESESIDEFTHLVRENKNAKYESNGTKYNNLGDE
jgi:hypothetical protein